MLRSLAFSVVLCAAPALAQGKAKAKAAPDAGTAATPSTTGSTAPSLPAFSPTGQQLLPDGGVAPSEGKADIQPGQEKPKTRYFEGMGNTPEQQAQLEELSKAIALYEEESKEYKREIQLLVEKKYEEKRNTLANSYEKAIRDLEVLERRERLDAIAQFEEFLRRYPDDPKYSPDVMFRLAELYYERSSDDHTLAMREYEEQLKKLDPDKNPTLPPEPRVDFTKSVAIYKDLIRRFPDYRLNDASYYLLGYCQEKMDDFQVARDAYQQLIARYPKSKFTTEAWVRIGEYYFDAYDEANALDKAADAYEHAIADTEHALYDKAVYKLGWTYYRMDKFDPAVDKFVALIDFYEAEAKKRGDEEAGGDLRNEALQYTAISFVDEKWGSLQKAIDYFQKIGGRKYEPEIYRRMGDVYFDQTKHTDAIEAYRLVLQKDPLAKDAPQIQQKIVQAYERDRKLEEAFGESSRLSNMFSPGTPWHDKWRRDPDVITAAGEMAEKSLYSTAIYHHQQAIVYKNEGKFEQAKATFEMAAKAYQGYLQRFPRSKNAYELQFYYAECLYNSFQFVEAAKQYALVRDSTQDVKYQAESAFSAVLALQKQLELDQKAGKIPELKVVLSKDRPENEKIVATPLTEQEQLLVAASDAYIKRAKDGDERAPGIAYKAAELFYVHNQYDEARKRFKAVIVAWPKTEVAKYAANLTVETYLTEKNWVAVEQVTAELFANKDVIDPKSDLAKNLTKFKLGSRFKLAEDLMAKGAYEDAAKKYLELVDEEPKHEFADKALNNAAVCYENVRRFDSALKLYERIFREYPKSTLADAALFRVAYNSEQSYDFEKAVENYKKLVKDYPSSKDREAAVQNTARLLEGQQRYDEAAREYLRHADMFPKSEDAPKNQFRAALIYEKTSDWNKEIAALNEFVQKFAKDQKQVELVVDAKKRIGDAYQKLGRETEARKAYAAAADEFDKRGLKPETNQAAANSAAQSRFQLAEYQFKEFDKLKIGGSGNALAKSFTVKKDFLKKLQEAYTEVFKYKSLEWTLAAGFRKGYALERFAQTIVETPVPPEVKRLGEEAVVTYQDALAQQTVVLEDKAVESYAITLAEARKVHISNEWTKKTLESLNRFRPKEYPVLKEARSVMSQESVYQTGVVTNAEGPVRAVDAPQKLKGDDK